GVDVNPKCIKRAEDEGITTVFGDAEDMAFLSHLPVPNARWIISTLPEREANEILMQGLDMFTRSGKLAIASYREDDAHYWQHHNIDLIMHPYEKAADRIVEQVGLSEATEQTASTVKP
ncbi:MAG: hypothetical protein EA349_14215, partial [Halomonadaceae bacterium]